MPWQQMVADIGGELDAATGLPAYREVIVTVPRQSGKTTLVLAWELQRALGWDGPQRIMYSAQSGKDAREKLLDDQVPLLYPKRKQLGIKSIRRANGNEAITFVNGSRINVLTSSSDSGHGKTIDLAVKDELFADPDDRRDQSMLPAMATRRAAQMLTTSTMGTDESIALNRAVELGRLAVNEDRRRGVAYFEWSAHPEEDPDDPAVWARCMPALGHTIDNDAVINARGKMSEGDFRRAFLNQQTKADERVIPGHAWRAVCDENVKPAAPLTFAVDVNPERSAAAIVASGQGPVCELVEFRPGTGWLADRCVELNTRHEPGAWVVDGSGPAGSYVPEFERAGLTVHAVTARELIEACGGLYDAVMERKIRVRYHSELDAAVAGAAKRRVGDAWAWTRHSASVDVCPLVALTLAAWGSQNLSAASVYEDRGLLTLG